jgi:CDP-diacylglycerol---serine O-phosphatidyltransferase
MNGYYQSASMLIFLSAFFDLFDGRIARSLRVNNRLGVELDSLADIVSFGVAPALLFHSMTDPSIITDIALLLYPSMGALRLARFNANPTEGYYIGLPIPIAGLIIALMGMFEYSNPYISIFLAILMVSPFKLKKL